MKIHFMRNFGHRLTIKRLEKKVLYMYKILIEIYDLSQISVNVQMIIFK